VEWTTAAGLRLHPDKTRIVDATQPGGFDFLGYHFERGYRWPSAKSLRKFQDKIRVQTKRTNGHSLQRIVSDLAKIQKGWFEYFKHSHWMAFRKLDRWIRMRLRSLLRRRQGRKGRGQGRDHNRWPNAFFAEQGLFSLLTAYARIRQSSPR
jgi:RNA-directed DNA polymerase